MEKTKEEKILIRISQDLKKRIKKKAKTENRSVNSQIINSLEKGLNQTD